MPVQLAKERGNGRVRARPKGGRGAAAVTTLGRLSLPGVLDSPLSRIRGESLFDRADSVVLSVVQTRGSVCNRFRWVTWAAAGFRSSKEVDPAAVTGFITSRTTRSSPPSTRRGSWCKPNRDDDRPRGRLWVDYPKHA